MTASAVTPSTTSSRVTAVVTPCERWSAAAAVQQNAVYRTPVIVATGRGK